MNFLQDKTLTAGLEHFSESIWLVAIWFVIALGAYFVGKTLFSLKNKISEPSQLNFANFIGPASISLGAMVGAGATVGVIGALNKYVTAANGDSALVYFESIAGWAFLIAIILVPISYCEPLVAKVMKSKPRQYISKYIGKIPGTVYAICFVSLTVFGFGGFQFSGIDSVGMYVTQEFMGMEPLSQAMQFLIFVLPVFLVVAALVLSKKHEVFMNAMTFMIGTAIVLYFIFFAIFLFKTGGYIPTFFDNLVKGMSQPITMGIGIPLGIVLGAQKVIQTAETGLGALAMAVQENDSKPREAGIIALFPTAITVIVSIFVTSYIVSYGFNNGIFNLPQADASIRLGSFFKTAGEVVPTFGPIVLCIFTLFSSITTILGSFYYLGKLFPGNENRNIAIYLLLILIAGTLAVFGATLVFEAVDLLLLVLILLNLSALSIFAAKGYKEYVKKK